MPETTIPGSQSDGAAANRSRQRRATPPAAREGDFSVRLPAEWDATERQIAAALRQAVSHARGFGRELERLRQAVGRAGQREQRMAKPGAIGGWAAEAGCYNGSLDDLVRPTRRISRSARTIGALAGGEARNIFAMPGERETCLEAGAGDNISKPVHADQLLSLMRSWLPFEAPRPRSSPSCSRSGRMLSLLSDRMSGRRRCATNNRKRGTQWVSATSAEWPPSPPVVAARATGASQQS